MNFEPPDPGSDKFGSILDSVDSDFRKRIDEEVSRCHVLLAIIGDNWVTISDDGQTRRLDDPNDLVRIEIESAMARVERVNQHRLRRRRSSFFRPTFFVIVLPRRGKRDDEKMADEKMKRRMGEKRGQVDLSPFPIRRHRTRETSGQSTRPLKSPESETQKR